MKKYCKYKNTNDFWCLNRPTKYGWWVKYLTKDNVLSYNHWSHEYVLSLLSYGITQLENK